MVGFGDFERGGALTVVLGEACYLVVEDVRQALEEQQRQQVILELGRVLLAANGAGRVPQHLFHRLGGRDCARTTVPASTNDLRGHRRRILDFLVDASFAGKGVDGCHRGTLRSGKSTFPAVNGGERDPKAPGELLLSQVEPGANAP